MSWRQHGGCNVLGLAPQTPFLSLFPNFVGKQREKEHSREPAVPNIHAGFFWMAKSPRRTKEGFRGNLTDLASHARAIVQSPWHSGSVPKQRSLQAFYMSICYNTYANLLCPESRDLADNETAHALEAGQGDPGTIKPIVQP